MELVVTKKKEQEKNIKKMNVRKENMIVMEKKKRKRDYKDAFQDVKKIMKIEKQEKQD